MRRLSGLIFFMSLVIVGCGSGSNSSKPDAKSDISNDLIVDGVEVKDKDALEDTNKLDARLDTKTDQAKTDIESPDVEKDENTPDTKQDATGDEITGVDVRDVENTEEVSDVKDIPYDDLSVEDVKDVAEDSQDVSSSDAQDVQEEEVVVPLRKGECKSSQDCDGHECVKLSIGWHVCLSDMPEEFTSCKPPKDPRDECCSSKDCENGAGCYRTKPITGYGTVPTDPFKFCIADECKEDSDCDSSIDKLPGLCLPAGLSGWPKTKCTRNYCAKFGGCKAGEYCRIIPGPCNKKYIMGAFCASPKTCETDDDCKDGKQCVGDTNTGRTICRRMVCPM